MSFRRSTLKTLQLANPVNLFQHPLLIQNRHFGSSYAQLVLQYTMAYAENSLIARTFVYSYQGFNFC